MKQKSKVIVVLVVVGIASAAMTLLGVLRPDNDENQTQKYRQRDNWPSWLTNVGNLLNPTLPPIDLSRASYWIRNGDVVPVAQAVVTIEVPPSENGPRQADLSLQSGPSVGVHLPNEEDTREDKQKATVTISGEGGTILLRRPPAPKDGDIVLTRKPQYDDTVPTPEPQDDEISRVRVRFDGWQYPLSKVSYWIREGAVVPVAQALVTIEVPPSKKGPRQADLRLKSGSPFAVTMEVRDNLRGAGPPEKPQELEFDKKAVTISGEGGTILLRWPPVSKDGDVPGVLFE